jgi:predicted ferric reductase
VLVVIAAGFLQNKFAFFKWAHRLAPVVALLGWLHSINIGTETRSIATIGFYLFFFCLVLYAFIKKHVSLSR